MAETGVTRQPGTGRRAFELPDVYVPPSDAGYRPAWEGASPIGCNLVLEGGAMRGQFTAGVLDSLMDSGVFPRMAIGVSAGALHGLNYVAGSRGRSCYLNLKYCRDWRYFSMRSFVLTGSAFNERYSFERIPNELEPFDFASFARSPLTLIAVTSDIVCGEAVYTTITDAHAQMDYLRASSAMPVVSRIVTIDGKQLLDGGICDPVPLEFSRMTGAAKHIVVLTQHAGYVKKPSDLMSLIRAKYRRYPRFVECIASRHIVYNDTYRMVQKAHDDGEVFIIRPPEPVTVKSMEHDPHKLYALYLSGYAEAEKNLDAIKRYLES
jgi:predicted patatin/cPLA2 family phospholipase